MGLLTGLFSKYVLRNRDQRLATTKSDYIFYKIVDLIKADEYSLQCINTNAIFHAKIDDIVFDADILYGLHPIQACYVGIEYANLIKKSTPQREKKNLSVNNLQKYSICRYGSYLLHSQKRSGELIFTNITTNEEFIMDARDIALTEYLISEFDAAQAFYIGLTAGIKINNPVKESIIRRPHLKLIK